MAKSIVLVDDSTYLLKIIKTFMEEVMGFDVLAMGHNGNDAVKLYAELQPDLITLDITMPQKDGFQALREIIQEFPEAKVVMMSAIRSHTFTECINEGAAAFIEKPLKFHDEDFVEYFKEIITEIIEE